MKSRTAATVSALLALALWAGVSMQVRAQSPAVDPAAVQILKRMCDYLGGLQQFSLHTQNTVEDLLDAGHRVDFDVSAKVTISRPNKLSAERRGGLIDQDFYYDGKVLTLHNPSDKMYATVPAPATVEGVLDYTRDTLGLIIPASDLVYRNNFELLMQDVTVAIVVGKEVIGGVRCDHLLFSRPGVDFQVCVADAGQPLPRRYVVTDTSTPARVSVSTVTSEWNVAPGITDDRFSFVPPQGAESITFLPLETSGDASR